MDSNVFQLDSGRPPSASLLPISHASPISPIFLNLLNFLKRLLLILTELSDSDGSSLTLANRAILEDVSFLSLSHSFLYLTFFLYFVCLLSHQSVLVLLTFFQQLFLIPGKLLGSNGLQFDPGCPSLYLTLTHISFLSYHTADYLRPTHLLLRTVSCTGEPLIAMASSLTLAAGYSLRTSCWPLYLILLLSHRCLYQPTHFSPRTVSCTRQAVWHR